MNIPINIKIQYNSPVILTLFFISLIIFLLNCLSKGKLNNKFFSTSKTSLLSPLTYFTLISHILGHSNFNHLKHNYLFILLIGPIIEEKYGSLNLLYMILMTAWITGLVNFIIGKYKILGASSIVYMLIILSSLVNLQTKTIPLTLILIIIFYIIEEIISLKKKDDVSHLSHLIGAICGGLYGFYL